MEGRTLRIPIFRFNRDSLRKCSQSQWMRRTPFSSGEVNGSNFTMTGDCWNRSSLIRRCSKFSTISNEWRLRETSEAADTNCGISGDKRETFQDQLNSNVRYAAVRVHISRLRQDKPQSRIFRFYSYKFLFLQFLPKYFSIKFVPLDTPSQSLITVTFGKFRRMFSFNRSLTYSVKATSNSLFNYKCSRNWHKCHIVSNQITYVSP